MAKKLQVVPDEQSTALEMAVEDYLGAVHARGGSARTDEYYGSILRGIFLPWCAARGVTEPAQLDQRTLDAFNAHLLGETSSRTGKPLSRASVATYLRAVRQFLRWSQAEGLAPDKVTVQQVKAERKVLETLSREEISQLEAAAPTERDKLIIRLLGDAGLRLGELLALTAADLVEQGRERYVRVKGKGARERLVPLYPAVYQRLKRFAEKGRPEDCYSERIFVSLRRRPASNSYEPLDERAVQVLLKAAADRAGITKRVNPHTFRHSMITNSLRKGSNPVVLARMVGHSDASMIAKVYEHLLTADLHREMMRILSADEG